MTSLSSPRRTGVLIFWHISESGGFGKILIQSTRELFFIHRKFIISGVPFPGAQVTFTPEPPLEGKVYPQATEAVIDNTKIIRGLKVPDKVGA
jgi:hypothetical protein